MELDEMISSLGDLAEGLKGAFDPEAFRLAAASVRDLAIRIRDRENYEIEQREKI